MKTIITIVILFAVFQTANAQKTVSKFRINGYAGYVFDDGFDSYYDANSYYDGTIKGGFQWGIGAEYLVHQYYGIELLYYRQDTEAPTQYYQFGVKNTDFDVAVNYILVAGNRYFKLNNPVVVPYAGFMLGVAVVDIKNPDNGNSNNATKFAWGIRGGANFNTSARLAIKVQAQLLSAAQSAGGGLYFGTGGVGTGLSTYSSIYQFGFTGGIALNF
jgi:hypothetical protein